MRRFLHFLGDAWSWNSRSRRNADTEFYVVYIAAAVFLGVWLMVDKQYFGTFLAAAVILILAAILRRARR